jgi:hypothetical protein
MGRNDKLPNTLFVALQQTFGHLGYRCAKLPQAKDQSDRLVDVEPPQQTAELIDRLTERGFSKGKNYGSTL